MKAVIKQMLKRLGYWDLVLYRLFIISQPGFLLNVLVQYLFAVNFRCRWLVHYTSKIIAPNKLTIDITSARSLAVSGGLYIQSMNGIIIKENVLIGPGVKLISSNHSFNSNDRSSMAEKPIVIGPDCWLGANAIILPGIELGINTIVGAGSIVTKSFTQGNVILAGNPARIIRSIDNGKF